MDHVRRGAGLHGALRSSSGVIWATSRVINNVRWAIEERAPTPTDQRNTFFAPWRLTRVLLALWGLGTVVLTTLYALQNTDFIPKWLLGVSFPGIVVSASCYLFTEFALRPVAAQALEVGPPPRRFAAGHHGPHDAGVGARVPASPCWASSWPPSSR